MDNISTIVFPGGFNWPLFVAAERGFFERERLDVSITPTPNSVHQMTSLIGGDFDIAMTAFDNVVAYRDGATDAKASQQADVVAVSGGDRGFLSLVSTAEFTDISSLKGRKVAVDALTTGYAFVLMDILASFGLAKADVEFVKVGGVADRFKGLLQHDFDATLLVSPFDLIANAKGFRTLASASTQLGSYQGVVAAVRRSWALENRELLVRFIRAQVAGVQWLYAPENRDEAIRILIKYLPQIEPELAQASYAAMVDGNQGFQQDAAVDLEGMQTVLGLRRKYVESCQGGRHLSDYIDLSFYNDALQDEGRVIQ